MRITAGVRGTDTLDVRILRLLLQGRLWAPLNPDFRESLADIAKKIGADEDTVRYRLKKLEEPGGFIADWRLTVNPSIWGGGQVCVWFDVPPSSPKSRLVEELRLVPGVIFVHTWYDAAVVFLQFDDAIAVPREIELIRRLSGAPDVFVARTAFPECKAVLTTRDWDLIRALRKHPRKSTPDLAVEVGLSTRTVRTRLSRLVAQGVAFAWPSLNLRAARGGVLIHLFVKYPIDRKAEIDESVTAHLEPHLWHVLHMLPYHRGELCPCGYNLLVPNVSFAKEVLSWAKAVPGIEAARVYLHEDIFNFFDVYDEELERKLSRMPTAMPAVRIEADRRPALTPAQKRRRRPARAH